ncbi:MAG: hypothetical protein ACJ8LN_00280, partial [Sulfurifustis sp.]
MNAIRDQMLALFFARRNVKIGKCFGGLGIAALLLATVSTQAAPPSYRDVPGCVESSLPSNDARYPSAQLIVTCVPPPGARVAWNGVLLIGVHGYVEPDDPLALPALEEGGIPAARALLDLGFGFATTSFHKNGYAVEQAGNDIDALVQAFKNSVASPRTVLLVGASEGGLITTMLIERNPATYAGGLALCGPLGGANAEIDYLTDFRVVFDYLFPQVFDFGAANVPASAAANWPGYETLIRDAIANEPDKADALFRVTGAARASEGAADTADTAVLLLRYTIFGYNDLVQVAGGNPY